MTCLTAQRTRRSRAQAIDPTWQVRTQGASPTKTLANIADMADGDKRRADCSQEPCKKSFLGSSLNLPMQILFGCYNAGAQARKTRTQKGTLSDGAGRSQAEEQHRLCGGFRTSAQSPASKNSSLGWTVFPRALHGLNQSSNRGYRLTLGG